MYYFSEKNIRGNHAGTKARNDVEEILKRNNCIPFNKRQFVLTSDSNENIQSNINNRIQLFSLDLDIKKIKNEVVFVQYPMLAFDTEKEFYKLIKKKNKLVLLVHDVHGLKRQNQNEINKEIEILNIADAVIVHNRFMKAKLIQLGLTVQHIYLLNIFDYLTESKLNINRFKKNSIIFAGNLDKSDFFKEFCKDNKLLRLNLYGPHYDHSLDSMDNLKYIGNYNPDILPEKLIGQYGLVWDGDQINTCHGIYGEYTKYNNPHKLSLYLSSGMPVIVWKEAAIAEFVENNHVGLTVSTLSNLYQLINNITKAEYETMCKNVLRIREELINGKSLSKVINEINADFKDIE